MYCWIVGGVDSTFSLIKACENGLRPLAVHLDNGWNSELAQNNISSLVRKYNIDLITHVIDWKEYRNYQEAFLANVIDVELLMDNAMLAVNYYYANGLVNIFFQEQIHQLKVSKYLKIGVGLKTIRKIY